MKLDNHLVYLYKDTEDVVVYVGHGTEGRHKCTSGRNKKLKEFLTEGNYSIEVYKNNLSKNAAIDIEIELIEKYSPVFNINKPFHENPITVEECTRLFYYSEESPTLLKWNIDVPSGIRGTCIRTRVGDNAGSMSTYGYYRVSVRCKSIFAHRILWCLYNNQDIPEGMVINHINGIRSDNRKENLELCWQFQNCARTLRKPAGKSGVVGVSIKTSKNGIKHFYATVRFRGQLYEKGFSCRKYGESSALELAILWRESKLKELGIK